MQQFEDLPPEYRQGTYLGRLPRELRQLTTRYSESCNYRIRIVRPQHPQEQEFKIISITDKPTLVSYIPFQRGIINGITMREFILNVKQNNIPYSYRVTSSLSIAPDGIEKDGIVLYNGTERPHTPIVFVKLCRELEDALLAMEAFQNS